MPSTLKTPPPLITQDDSAMPYPSADIGHIHAFHRSQADVDRVLLDRANALAKSAALSDVEASLISRQMIRFRVGDSFYGIDLNLMREICKADTISVIPCTPKFILGLIQVHGEITPTVDLMTFFGFRRVNPLPQPFMVIVLEVQKVMLGIAVDELEEVYPIPKNQIRNTPAILGAIEQDTVSGVMPDGTILLDAAALTAHPRLCVGKRKQP
jgi:purine-binding chemotaxis protein CheW